MAEKLVFKAYPEPAVRLQDVVKTYSTGAGEFPALRGINVDIYPGEFIAVVGKSGAGKSTLVNMITGVDTLTAGEVWVGDTSVHQLEENSRALWRGQTIGVIYQSFELLPQLSLIDNVLLPMDMCGLYKRRESYERAVMLLEQVGLAAHMHKPPSRISGGQQQRVAIARALANDPSILIADEPTGSLDTATSEDILALFEQWISRGKTLVMVTHDLALASRASRTLRLEDGRLSSQAA